MIKTDQSRYRENTLSLNEILSFECEVLEISELQFHYIHNVCKHRMYTNSVQSRYT